MADVVSISKSSIRASLDTTTATEPITVRGSRLVDISVNIGAGDVLAVQGEYFSGAWVDGAPSTEWATIESYIFDTVKVLRVAAARRLRLKLTTANASPTTVELTVGNKE